MREGRAVAVTVLALCLLGHASAAAGQPGDAGRTQPASAAKAPWLNNWDASGLLGWVTAGREGGGTDYEVLWAGGTFGRFWNEHFKTEADISSVGTINDFAYEGGVSQWKSSEIRRREVKLSGAVVYQFRSNVMTHPFVGAGVAASFNRTTTQWTVFTMPCTSSCQSVETASGSDVSTATEVEPFAMAGVKFFLSRSAFIRLDGRFGVTGGQLQTAVRCGVGLDF